MIDIEQKFDKILKSKIEDILDQIEKVNHLMSSYNTKKSPMDDFMLFQFKYHKIDFLKQLCQVLIESNVATTKQIDAILDTINHLKDADDTKIIKDKPLEIQLNRIDSIIKEEQLYYSKTI